MKKEGNELLTINGNTVGVDLHSIHFWETAVSKLTVSGSDLGDSVNKVQGHTLGVFTPIFMCDDSG